MFSTPLHPIFKTYGIKNPIPTPLEQSEVQLEKNENDLASIPPKIQTLDNDGNYEDGIEDLKHLEKPGTDEDLISKNPYYTIKTNSVPKLHPAVVKIYDTQTFTPHVSFQNPDLNERPHMNGQGFNNKNFRLNSFYKRSNLRF